MEARKLLPGVALAALILLGSSRADAEVETAVLARAELAGPELKLCVERDGRYETLRVDLEDLDAPLLSDSGCGDFGGGERLLVLDEERPGAVYLDGSAAVYLDEDGNVLRIPLDVDSDEAPPYEDSAAPRSDPDRDGTIRRVPTRRGSSRIVLPGPRAGEIGDATRDATLGGLEQTLDPVVEPPLALTLRGVSAAVGFAVGAALYVPTTLLDVLETEYGIDDGYGAEPDEEPIECDPYEPYDPGPHGGCR